MQFDTNPSVGELRKRALGQVRAVVVRLDTTSRVVGVDVEGVQVGADLLRWGEVLDHAGAGIEDFVLHGQGAAGGWCFFAAHVFVCVLF